MEKIVRIICLCIVFGLFSSLVFSFVTDFKVMLLVTLALWGTSYIKKHFLGK